MYHDMMYSLRMRIALEPPQQPEVLALMAELDAFHTVVYPSESIPGTDIDALGQPNVLFAVARDAQGQAVGCGAVVLESTFGQLRRMFVAPSQRGQGIAKELLVFLEAQAVARGCGVLRLETGSRQADALALYARSGYVRRDPFGGLTNGLFSVFMEKRLGD